MKKKAVAPALLALAILPAFAEDYLENPIVVTMTSVRQESRTQDLVVDYTLANHPGIVRMDVLTNGVSIGAQHLVSFTGDYSATEADVVQPGTHTFRWRARKDWRANLATNATIHHEVLRTGLLSHGRHRHDDWVFKIILRERREDREREERRHDCFLIHLLFSFDEWVALGLKTSI